MPVKRLPKKLIDRLRDAVEKEKNLEERKNRDNRVARVLGRMRNIDHRRDWVSIRAFPKDDINTYGRRVRELNVQRNFPQVQSVVIKLTHSFRSNPDAAKKTISFIKSKVREHNATYRPRTYVLRQPHAYAISSDLIAMVKADFPAINEIIGGERKRTSRGQTFFETLRERHRVTKEQLSKAIHELSNKTMFSSRTIILLGVKNKKFVFMPLIDII